MDLHIASDSPILQIAHILAAVLIILGLRRLSSPATARSGNQLAAVGLFGAVLITLFNSEVQDYLWILLGVPIGAVIGYVARAPCADDRHAADGRHLQRHGRRRGGARVDPRVHASPQPWPAREDFGTLLTTLLGLIIGSLSIAGSIIAFGKLRPRSPPDP